MATFNYPSLQATAGRLLERFGGSMQLEWIVDGEFDRDSGIRPQVPLQETVTAALLDAKQRWLEGTLVKVGDKRALIAATDVTHAPVQGDYLIAPQSGRFYIDEAAPLRPDDQTVLLWAATLTQGSPQNVEESFDG